jgi:hypothetical protein
MMLLVLNANTRESNSTIAERSKKNTKIKKSKSEEEIKKLMIW